MAHNYYIDRYLTLDQFVKFCGDSNLVTDKRELEYYEKTGIMLPVIRIIYPEEYIQLRTLWFFGVINEFPNLNKWPELSRLFDTPRVLQEQYADLHDNELMDSFDREIGNNPYLIYPTPETYKSWDSYDVLITYQEGHQVNKSVVEHYFCYWQIHQLYYIKQYPDLYKNKFLLDQISDDNRRRNFPRAPNQDTLRGFKGLAIVFDALSFWITMYNRERNRTFALIPEEHQVKHLDTLQLQAYRDRLASDAKFVQTRYELTVDGLYEFLHQLLNLYDDYRKNERYKLSEELRNDIIFQAQLIEILSGCGWEAIAEELGVRYTIWVKQNFRYLNIFTKERDEARDLMTLFAGKYANTLGMLNIPDPKHVFLATEIDEFIEYCEHEGLSILLTSLSGLIASQDDYSKKFRRVSIYTSMKNVLTTLEFLLKIFAQKGNIPLAKRSTLYPTVREMMKKESWNSLFVEKTRKGFTGANDSTEFYNKLNELVCDTDLVQSEDAYWARVFLIASLARNLTVHTYPDDDWFYGKLFNEMLQAAIYALMYSWQIAQKEGWT